MKNILSKRGKSQYLLSLFGYQKEDLVQRGIYSISFNGSNKIYIGSATQSGRKWNERGFYVRWRYHLYELINNTHYSKKLQYSFNKYGIENIKFLIVKPMPNAEGEVIVKEEQEMIGRLNCVKNGYNSCVKDTFEAYIQKGDFKTKKVFVFNQSGEFEREFASRTDCAAFFNIPLKKVSCNLKKNYAYNGYLFFDEKRFYLKDKKVYIKRVDMVVFDSKNKSIHSFTNVYELASFFSIKDRRNIYLCLSKSIPSTNGLIILYKSDISKIKIPTKTFFCITDGDFIVKKYESLRILCKELGYSKTSVENYVIGIGRPGLIKHEIKKLKLPITIYQDFINLIETK